MHPPYPRRLGPGPAKSPGDLEKGGFQFSGLICGCFHLLFNALSPLHLVGLSESVAHSDRCLTNQGL